MTKPIEWLEQPEDHNYPAALSYLSLLFDVPTARRVMLRLMDGGIEKYKAKDILRASGLKILDTDNKHVEKNLEKIEDGKALSPVLLVRGQPLLIADGYHRVCSVYHHDEDAWVYCKIVGAK